MSKDGEITVSLLLTQGELNQLNFSVTQQFLRIMIEQGDHKTEGTLDLESLIKKVEAIKP